MTESNGNELNWVSQRRAWGCLTRFGGTCCRRATRLGERREVKSPTELSSWGTATRVSGVSEGGNEMKYTVQANMCALARAARSAAMLAFRLRNWKCFSIDPAMEMQSSEVRRRSHRSSSLRSFTDSHHYNRSARAVGAPSGTSL